MYLTLLLSIYIPLVLSSYIFIAFTPLDLATRTLRFKINGGGRLFFREFWRLPAAYFDPPPFINFSNISRDYTEVHKYIIDS